MKRIVLIIVSVLILLGIPATIFLVMRSQELRQRAAPATTLTLSPATVSKQVGDEFTLDARMDTAANQVVAVQVSVSFDPTKLEAVWIHNGTMFPNIISSGVVGNGTASIALGAANTTTPITGAGLAATIKFKAIAATTSPISIKFSQDTFVGALGEGSTNVLTSTTPTNVTITGGVNPTPTLVLTPTPTGTSSATPSAVTISYPLSNATISTALPVVKGKAPAGSTVTIAVYSTQQITATVTADASGNWTYTVPQTLDEGAHTIVVAAQNPTTGQTETATIAFVVSTGNAIDATGSAMPISGSTEPTLILLGLGILLFVGGSLIPAFQTTKL